MRSPGQHRGGPSRPRGRVGFAPRHVAGGLLLALASAMAMAACGHDVDAPALDVALEVEVGPEAAAPGEPLRILYTWRPGPSFEPPDGELTVFLHLLGPDREIVMQGDHFPPVPVSEWEASRPVEYERWLYLPLDLDPMDIGVVAGLYDEDTRYRISHGGATDTTPRVAELTITDRDIAAVPVPVEGWYPMASDGNQPFHWTRGRAAVLFRNPGTAAVLHLSAQAVVDMAGGAQTVVVRVEGQEVGRVEIADQRRFTRRFDLSSEVLGDDEQVRVSLEVSPTFVPAEVSPDSPDDRVLGIRVFTLFLAPDDGEGTGSG